MASGRYGKLMGCVAAGALLLLPLGAGAQGVLVVTSSADSGEGSLRAALQTASAAHHISPIMVATEGDIEIASTLTYSGRSPLYLLGDRQTVRIRGNQTILALTEGADLSASNLDFAGPGGFDIEHRGDTDGEAGKGIFIDVREDQRETVSVHLINVKVTGVAYHGVHVSDCDLANECGGGSGGGGGGSAASISVKLEGVTIQDVGNGAFDGDGIRIDERGPGSIGFSAYMSSFTDVGADGVELDEGGEGEVFSTIVDSGFEKNGGYCDEKALSGFLPNPARKSFADGEATDSDVPPAVSGSPDDRCIEREVEHYPSGAVKSYAFAIDFDDGVDFDEAGPGSLTSIMLNSKISGSLDEGVDLDEEDEGNAHLAFVRVTANDNTDDGIRASESGPGNLDGAAVAVTAKSNGGNGIRLEEKDDGLFDYEIDRANTASNDDGKDAGIRVAREGDGEGRLILRASKVKDGIDARNVKVEKE